MKFNPFRFSLTIDGYFFPKSPYAKYEAGEQARVPLLVGWNSQEMDYCAVLEQNSPTVANYTKAVQKLHGERAVEVLKVYNASTDAEVEQAATDLAGDRFIGFSTWKWSTLHSKRSVKPVYRYLLHARSLPAGDGQRIRRTGWWCYKRFRCSGGFKAGGCAGRCTFCRN
jgi:para-nitrobenzyl esterase